MIVKICGIKTLEDALAAVAAGADMLGFNFYPPSPRYITPQTCADIVAELSPHRASLLTVGVFVNETPQRIAEILDTCGLNFAQLSGDESVEDFDALDGKALKAVRPQSMTEADELHRKYARDEAPALLVDAHVRGAYGGTGETTDWVVARHLAEQASILLAGGLNPENVAAAVRAVNPWGVDVASGVESSPGTKDSSKMAAFIAAVRLESAR